jgi:uncharacterized protein (TIGR02996 family)
VSTERALLAAILANPDDDLPRLVYADWLEENGRPRRAEFIRVECETARTNHELPAYVQLLRRSDQLSKRNAQRWFGQLADEGVFYHFITSRGFVESLVLSLDLFTTHADVISNRAPLLRELHIRTGGDWRAFFASPALSAIRALSFEDGVFTDDAAEELAASKHTTALTRLELDRQPLGPNGVAAVARASFRALERLSVAECDIGDDGAEELFAAANVPILRELDLSENGLTDATCLALAASCRFGRLERLILCNNHITDEGVSAMAAAPHLDQLRTLNLYSNPIGPNGGRAILTSRHWAGLIELNLVGCGVGVAVVGDLRWVYGEKAVKA